MKINKQGLIIGVILYAFMVFCWMCTNSFVGDASLFPRMILVLFALLNTIMVIQSFQGKGKVSFTAKEVAYMLILKVKPYWLIAALTAGYLAFVYVLFVVWLKTNII